MEEYYPILRVLGLFLGAWVLIGLVVTVVDDRDAHARRIGARVGGERKAH